MNVWKGIGCALRWGVALVGGIFYWTLLTPSLDPLFRYKFDTGEQRSDEAVIVKKADMWPRKNFCKKYIV